MVENLETKIAILEEKMTPQHYVNQALSVARKLNSYSNFSISNVLKKIYWNNLFFYYNLFTKTKK